MQTLRSGLLRNTAGFSVTTDDSWEASGQPLPPERVYPWSGGVKYWSADSSFRSLIESKLAALLSCVIAKMARACYVSSISITDAAAAINPPQQHQLGNTTVLVREGKQKGWAGKTMGLWRQPWLPNHRKSGVGIGGHSGQKTIGQQSCMDFFHFSLLLAFGAKAHLNNKHALEASVSLKIETPGYSNVISSLSHPGNI